MSGITGGCNLPIPLPESTQSVQEEQRQLPNTVEVSIRLPKTDAHTFTGTELLQNARNRGISLPTPAYSIEETNQGYYLCPSAQLIESYFTATADQAIALHAEGQSREDAYEHSRETYDPGSAPWKVPGLYDWVAHSTVSVDAWNDMQKQLDSSGGRTVSTITHGPTGRRAKIRITPQHIPPGSTFRSRWTIDGLESRRELFPLDREWSEDALMPLNFEDGDGQGVNTTRGPLITNDEIRGALGRLQAADSSLTPADRELLTAGLMSLRSQVLETRWFQTSAGETELPVKLTSGAEATLRCLIDPLQPRAASEPTA